MSWSRRGILRRLRPPEPCRTSLSASGSEQAAHREFAALGGRRTLGIEARFSRLAAVMRSVGKLQSDATDESGQEHDPAVPVGSAMYQ